jgi:hypothetical protein
LPPSGEKTGLSISMGVPASERKTLALLLGQMAFQIARIVKNPHYINHVFSTAPVHQKMAGLSDYAQITCRAIAAEEEVVGPDTARQIRTLLGSGPPRIGRDVSKRLLEKGAVTGSGALAESLLGPDQCFADINPCGGSENDPISPAGLRHAGFFE